MGLFCDINMKLLQNALGRYVTKASNGTVSNASESLTPFGTLCLPRFMIMLAGVA